MVTDGAMLEFLQSHTNVIYQPPVTANWYRGINPYALGFAMYQDIKRVCEAPTDEDRAWFPDIAGGNWHEVLDFAMRNFKDESFISQYMSPNLIRNFRFFSIRDSDLDDKLEVTAIHDDAGYQAIRSTLSEQYNLGSREPNIQVWSVNVRGDRSLTLRHTMHERRPLESGNAEEVLKHVARLWGFDVRLESVDDSGHVCQTYDAKSLPLEYQLA
jgi:stage V sporulation protein R